MYTQNDYLNWISSPVCLKHARNVNGSVIFLILSHDAADCATNKKPFKSKNKLGAIFETSPISACLMFTDSKHINILFTTRSHAVAKCIPVECWTDNREICGFNNISKKVVRTIWGLDVLEVQLRCFVYPRTHARTHAHTHVRRHTLTHTHWPGIAMQATWIAPGVILESVM